MDSDFSSFYRFFASNFGLDLLFFIGSSLQTSDLDFFILFVELRFELQTQIFLLFIGSSLQTLDWILFFLYCRALFRTSSSLRLLMLDLMVQVRFIFLAIFSLKGSENLHLGILLLGTLSFFYQFVNSCPSILGIFFIFL